MDEGQEGEWDIGGAAATESTPQAGLARSLPHSTHEKKGKGIGGTGRTEGYAVVREKTEDQRRSWKTL